MRPDDELPPDWAIENALATFNAVHPTAFWDVDKIKGCSDRSVDGFRALVTRLARYIAEHEEPPVDPLLIEARNIVARHHEFMPTQWTGHRLIAEASGDDWGSDVAPVVASVTMAFAALKRGLELAREADNA